MLIGYARISKNDGSQLLDLQQDALRKAGVLNEHIYKDQATGANNDRPGLSACLKALRPGDVLVVWKLDRLGRSLHHLVSMAQDLQERGIDLNVLSGQGAYINTTTAAGKMVFGIFAALAEFERELIRERTRSGLSSARQRGRIGGRRFVMSKSKIRLAQAAMGSAETCVGALCQELGITRSTLYRYVGPRGELRAHGKKVLNA